MSTLSVLSGYCQGLEEDVNRASLSSWYGSVRTQTAELSYGESFKVVWYSADAHPFLGEKLPKSGELIYRGKKFENVEMLYDQHLDNLIIRHPDVANYPNQFLTLNKNQVEQFEIYGAEYVLLNHLGDMFFVKTCFLGEHIELFAKVEKWPSQNGDNSKIEYKQRSFYYSRSEQGVEKLKNPRDLVKLFPDLKEGLRRLEKELKRTPVSTEEKMVELTRYCDRQMNQI